MSGMHIQSEICHIDPEKTVVRVRATRNGTELGSALGEGGNAETAEDRAIQRLVNRIKIDNQKIKQQSQNVDQTSKSNVHPKVLSNIQPKVEQSKVTIKQTNVEPTRNNTEISQNIRPTNWTEELSQIDNHLTRLGWNKDDEGDYLIKEFNIRSRSRITDYDILKTYLNNLKELKSTDKKLPININIDRDNLIKESDSLITKIGFTEIEAREYLIKKMNTNSRQNLNNQDLKDFNRYLRELTSS